MTELARWKESLPSALQVKKVAIGLGVHLPVVYELHLQHEETMILLCRPFLGLSEYEGENPPGAMSPEVSRQRCFAAASSICAFLSAYRRQYGLKRMHFHMVHIISTAALIHVYYTCIIGGPEGKSAQDMLLVCMQALGEMGQTYRSASRALEVISQVRNDWRSRIRSR